jgi:hypothetical protein
MKTIKNSKSLEWVSKVMVKMTKIQIGIGPRVIARFVRTVNSITKRSSTLMNKVLMCP